MKVFIGAFPGAKSKKDRVVKIRIDKFDSWSADTTLAMIAVPLLKQLKETKHGAPCVDYNDVPANLRPTAKEIAQYKENGKTDPKFFKRWDWVMDEMIWALNEIVEEKPGEDKCFSGEADWQFKDIPGSEFKQMVHGPKHTFKIDKKAFDAYHKRLANGTLLFGKYFQSLWD